MHVNCAFKLKNEDMLVPPRIAADLFEACQMLDQIGDYYVSYRQGCFHFGTYWERLELDDDMSDLIKDKKLSRRHLRAFFWLKRNTVYEGDSWNPCDFEFHPDDFFKYVEDAVRQCRK